MSKVQLQFPPSVKVMGALYTRANVFDLTEDMLQLELPGDLFIDVGWYPELDDSGTYKIIVFHDTVDETLERFETKDYKAVVRELRSLIDRYISESHSQGITIRSEQLMTLQPMEKERTKSMSPARSTYLTGRIYSISQIARRQESRTASQRRVKQVAI